MSDETQKPPTITNETKLAWHLKRIADAAGVPIGPDAKYGEVGDAVMKKLGALQKLEDVHALVDAANDALTFVKPDKIAASGFAQHADDIRRARIAVTKAHKAVSDALGK